MNLRSPWFATGVVLVTVVACYFGVRAELAQAHQAEAQRSAQFAAPPTADLAPP
jgi:hypothetical protein